MNRRELFRTSAGVAIAVPALAQSTGWKPQTLDAHQNETVVALTDLIIPATDTPGAKAANVNRYIDLLLTDGPIDDRNRFLEGLAFLDYYAIQKHNRPFARCTADQQTAILTAFEANAEAGIEPGNQFFRTIKAYTVRIYYATSIGIQELNKGGRVPKTFGCEHSGHA